MELMNRVAKDNPEAVLICGGVEATLNYQTILEKTPIEWIVTGYGEEALTDIIDGIKTSIPGTIRRVYSESLEEYTLGHYFSHLDFSKLNYETYWKQTAALYKNPNYEDINTVRLVTSSHCNRGCAFCSVTQWQKAAVGRLSKPAMLDADELKLVVSKVIKQVPDVRTVFFCEDDFCQDRKRVEEFCEWSKDTSIKYLVQTHLSHVDYDMIQTLKKGRVRHLTLGIENASMNVLKSFHKIQNLELVPDVIKWCIDAGINPYLLIILFAPASTIEDLKTNVKVLREWSNMGASISIEPVTMAYRGSPFWESLHDFEYDVIKVSPGINLKRALRILPDDPDARKVQLEFCERWPEYLKSKELSHAFKGKTSKHMTDLLEEILNEYNY
jgi:radical SAM superfamily enzyme YgiQ (UPF0313 family)